MICISKLCAFFTLLFVVPAITAMGNPSLFNFDKAAFYAAMASGKLDQVNSTLAQLKESGIPEMAAYEGALLMKKAGLVRKPTEKLSLFKAGRLKLEAAIEKDEENIEYHFLRLIIQQNAPKIVKYRGSIQKDAELVRSSFKKLPPVVQQAVRDYSQHSKFLKPSDF